MNNEALRIKNKELDQIFFALSDQNRRLILTVLVSHDLTVGTISKMISMSAALTSKHLKVLARCELIEQFKFGRTTISRLNYAKLSSANIWLSSVGLVDVLDVSRLESFLSDQKII